MQHLRAEATLAGIVRLLFLDFDGVLNSDAWFASAAFRSLTNGRTEAEVMLLDHVHHLDPAKVELVNRLVDTQNLTVIVSSSWRLQHAREALQAMLVARGATFDVADVTPRVMSRDPSRPLRAREIAAYLEGLASPPEAVLVLDDDALDGLVPGHVQTNGAEGLMERHLVQCERALERP